MDIVDVLGWGLALAGVLLFLLGVVAGLVIARLLVPRRR